ncbi:MAG: TfoX/Sxy family protein [Rhodospirillaceae bacterium]|nr:TfoX/Sxy family protein [Rhodospirillaceae bacterium]
MITPAGKKLVATLGAKLAPLGPFLARPMFGGFGLYIDGLIFGIMALDQVYPQGRRPEPRRVQRRRQRAVQL